MKRRILLLIGTFAVLSLAVWVWHLISGGVLILTPEGEDFPKMGHIGPRKLAGMEPDAQEGYDVDILDKPKGRLRGRYRAKRWTKRGDGSYLLVNPHVVMYQSNGEHVYIRSDYGDIIADEVGGGWTIRRGSLYGAVKIFLDRDTRRSLDQEKPEEIFHILEAAPEDPAQPRRVIRIYADDLRFNNDLLEVESDSRIALLSDEADIYGRGISIRWNEAPRELRMLRVHHGQYMAVYQVPGEFGMLALPGPSRKTEGPPTRPASLPAALAASTRPATASGPVSKPATQTATSRREPATTRAATASAPADIEAALAVTRPTRPLSRPKDATHSIFLAEFEGTEQKVHVDSGDRKLTGANTLSLIFEWGGDRERLARPRRGVRRGPSGPVTDTPTPPVASGPDEPAAASEPATTTAPTQPDRVSEPVVITWSGPLTIRPIGYTDSPSSRRYTVWADGHLRLSDPSASATCRRLIFQLPQQRGWLIGDDDADVNMARGDEQVAACRMLEFDRVGGLAHLTGPGQMARRGTGEAFLGATTRAATAPSTAPAGEDRITWGGRATIVFGEKESVDKDGRRSTRQYIQNVTFRDDVRLTQGTDFVRCDALVVEMAEDPRGRAYPAKAVAAGNVLARQEASDIRAREVTVTFEPDPKAKQDELRVRPVDLYAQGEVGIRDVRDEEVLTASADRLRSNLVERTAKLFGDEKHFATVTQGSDYLAGDELHLDEATESVKVKGRGELRFHSDRDLSGGKLKKPRPIRVEWDDGMRYAAGENVAKFDGNVALSSALDSMRCAGMQVMFEKAPPAASDKGKAGSAAGASKETKDSAKSGESAKPDTKDAAPARRLGVGMRRYSRRDLSMIVADKDVVIRSRELDEKKRLLQRLQITGAKLTYDVRANKLQVMGAGTLVAEDYRAPRAEKEAPEASDAAVAGLERPWQTLFEWDKSVEYSQVNRRVELHGNVSMVHRSGQQVILAERLKIPHWEDVPKGRKSVLSCQELVAVFGEPEKEEAPDKAEMSRGMRLGPLELFTAKDGVNLRDGPMQILGQRLIYDHKKGEAIVWGSLPGKPVKNAEVHREDAVSRTHQSWTSPTITVHFEGSEIKEVITKGVTGAGGT